MSTSTRESLLEFFTSYRFTILVLGTVCGSILQSNSLVHNFTKLCMDSVSTNFSTTAFVDTSSKDQEKWLLCAIAIGTLLGTYPCCLLLERLGTRTTFSLFGALSAIATLATPLAAGYHWHLFFMVRVLQGLAAAIIFPVQGTITTHWSPLSQTGLFIAWQSCYQQFGPLFTMPLSSYVCDNHDFGWKSAYFMQGAVTIVAFLLFFLVYRDSPTMHPRISSTELDHINRGKSLSSNGYGKDIAPVPYREIAKDWQVRGAVVSSIGAYYGIQLLLQYGPTYLKKVLNYSIAQTGFASALPYLLAMIVKFTAGPLSDCLTCISEKARVSIFYLTSRIAVIACFVTLALVSDSMVTVAQIAFTITIAVTGLNSVGALRNAQMVARQHFHFMLTIFSVINSTMILIIPHINTMIAPRDLPDEWKMVFYTSAAIVLGTTIFFMFVNDSSPAPWTCIEESSQQDPSIIGEKSVQIAGELIV